MFNNELMPHKLIRCECCGSLVEGKFQVAITPFFFRHSWKVGVQNEQL